MCIAGSVFGPGRRCLYYFEPTYSDSVSLFQLRYEKHRLMRFKYTCYSDMTYRLATAIPTCKHVRTLSNLQCQELPSRLLPWFVEWQSYTIHSEKLVIFSSVQRVNVVFNLRDVAQGGCDSTMMRVSIHAIPLSWLMDCKHSFIHSFIHSFMYVWFVVANRIPCELEISRFQPNRIECW